MPGFATTDDTKSNAHALMKELGIDAREVDIRPLANQMLADLDHPYSKGRQVYDITFENVQAGLRTDYLFRLANKEGGLVVGTGDLPELALGWCTYGVGDHMSHYNVNASMAKTLGPAHDPLVVPPQATIRRVRPKSCAPSSALRDLARAGAARSGREDPVHRRDNRPLQPARFLPGPHDPRWLRSPSKIAFLAQAIRN